jgi:hypothetical protein
MAPDLRKRKSGAFFIPASCDPCAIRWGIPSKRGRCRDGKTGESRTDVGACQPSRMTPRGAGGALPTLLDSTSLDAAIAFSIAGVRACCPQHADQIPRRSGLGPSDPAQRVEAVRCAGPVSKLPDRMMQVSQGRPTLETGKTAAPGYRRGWGALPFGDTLASVWKWRGLSATIQAVRPCCSSSPH